MQITVDFYKKFIASIKELANMNTDEAIILADKLLDIVKEEFPSGVPLSVSKKPVAKTTDDDGPPPTLSDEDLAGISGQYEFGPDFYVEGEVVMDRRTGKQARAGQPLPGGFVASDGTFTPDTLSKGIKQLN